MLYSKLFFIIIFQLFVIIFNSFSQIPSIQWQKNFGGVEYEDVNSIIQTNDGGYVFAGTTYSNDNDVSGNHNSVYSDFWVVKIDSAGSILWQKCLGGSNSDAAHSIQQTNDFGYIVIGNTNSNNGDVTGNHSIYNSDIWVVKLNSNGDIQWQKCYGGSMDEEAYSIQQIADGGYVIAGSAISSDGDVIGNHNLANFDVWILKINSLGVIQWKKCYGGNSSDFSRSIQQTKDKGYIIAGFSASNDGDLSQNHGIDDCWVFKLDSLGSILWQKCIGGSGVDWAQDVKQAKDGGYIVAGFTESFDGDVTANQGDVDCWIVKLDTLGVIQWQKSFGGTAFDYAYSIQQTTDDGYIFAGYTDSNNGDVIGHHGSNNYDYWVIKLNLSGNILWKKCLGGTSNDAAYSIKQTIDGGYIIAGSSSSLNGDVTGNYGGSDLWIVKLSLEVNVNESLMSELKVYPNPVKESFTINSNNSMIKSIEIIDVLGKVLYSQKVNSSEEIIILRNNIPSGLYILKANSADKSFTSKVLFE